MTRQEALLLLGFSKEYSPDTETIQDALEAGFFELKQRFYRAFEQLLLYPKFEKECLQFTKIQGVFSEEFPSAPPQQKNVVSSANSSLLKIVTNDIELKILLENLKIYQHQSAGLKKALFHCVDASELLIVIEKAKDLHLEWYQFWSEFEILETEPSSVKLSQILDAQSFYTQLDQLCRDERLEISFKKMQFKQSLLKYPQLQLEIKRMQVAFKKLKTE